MRQTTIFMMCCGIACFFVSAPSVAQASTSHSMGNPCDTAARTAAEISGVPADVLFAIARVETGRTVDGVLSPWPWSVNQGGNGAYFNSAQDALDHVLRAMADGHRNIDVGCFQINIRWHGAEFASLQAMFDPTENALYAARFLLQLHREYGSWDGAIGAYHSRHQAAATAYLAKVSALMPTLPMAPAPPAARQAAARDNRYPLLRPGKASGHGSLVTSALDPSAVPLLW